MGTAIVGLILVAVLAAIIFSLIKRKKKGIHSCGGKCSGCAFHCSSSIPKDGLCCTLLEIEGMMCPMCESHIKDAIRSNFDVKTVKASFKTGLCSILSKEPIDSQKIEEIIKNTGYQLKSINTYENKD